MALTDLLELLGPEIEDPDEETFLLFSQEIPSQNLGFIDPHATTLNLTIAGKDYTIHQSPTILNRSGSTTGAVVWKISPIVAQWLSSQANPIWSTGALSSTSSILELGCGISGLVGLTMSPLVSRYVLTDQPYVARLVEKNLEENKPQPSTQKRKGKASSSSTASASNLSFKTLDWETDEVTPSLTGTPNTTSFDLVLACDCIYNEALVAPLVQTCADVCRLRSSSSSSSSSSSPSRSSPSSSLPKNPTICLVAQQLRLPEVFESWIKEFSKRFRVWRVPEEILSAEMSANRGFVMHIGILKDADA